MNEHLFLSSIDEIKDWLNSMDITDYTINNDLTVDVNNSVYIDDRGLKTIPIQFGRVNGEFNCFNNELTSLKGVPFHVHGEFFASRNLLTNLNFLPKTIEYNIDLAWNQFNNVLVILPLLPVLKNNSIYSVFLTLEQKVQALKNISQHMSSHAMDDIYFDQFSYQFEEEEIDKLAQYLSHVYEHVTIEKEKRLLEKQLLSGNENEQKNIKI